MATKSKQRKVSLLEYAEKYNPQLNRRGKPMSWAYLYRLIRQDIEGNSTRPLWFKYTLEGEKDRIWVILEN
jgi:hypothetical protein